MASPARPGPISLLSPPRPSAQPAGGTQAWRVTLPCPPCGPRPGHLLHRPLPIPGADRLPRPWPHAARCHTRTSLPLYPQCKWPQDSSLPCPVRLRRGSGSPSHGGNVQVQTGVESTLLGRGGQQVWQQSQGAFSSEPCSSWKSTAQHPRGSQGCSPPPRAQGGLRSAQVPSGGQMGPWGACPHVGFSQSYT